jgi:MtN3 and saliva related transmembrane protein
MNSMNPILVTAVSITGILMSLGHFPQAYKIWRKKSARDVSITTYLIFFTGAWVWLIYGIALGEWPIIVSFIISVIGTTAVLGLTWRYR